MRCCGIRACRPRLKCRGYRDTVHECDAGQWRSRWHRPSAEIGPRDNVRHSAEPGLTSRSRKISKLACQRGATGVPRWVTGRRASDLIRNVIEQG